MPKPVFHSNGKKTVHQRIQHNVITPQHEEMIRYISESKFHTSDKNALNKKILQLNSYYLLNRSIFLQ